MECPLNDISRVNLLHFTADLICITSRPDMNFAEILSLKILQRSFMFYAT